MVWGRGGEGVLPIWSGAKELTRQVASHPVRRFGDGLTCPIYRLDLLNLVAAAGIPTLTPCLTFLYSCQQGFGSGSISGSGSAWIRINLSCWIRIRIRIQIADSDPGEQKWPTKIEKSTEFSCFEVLDVLFWGLKASPVAWASFLEA